MIYRVLFVILMGCSSFLFADGLKNSLSSMLDETPSSGLVNLNQPAPVKKVHKKRLKKHKSRATVATINRHKIIKREVDKYLKTRTGGKIKNYDLLPLVQRKKLIEEMAIPILVKARAKKRLSLMEKKAVYSRAWVEKKSQKIKIKNTELKKFYSALKEQAKQANQLKKLPSFSALKERLKGQLIEKKLIGKLMENVKIKVF